MCSQEGEEEKYSTVSPLIEARVFIYTVTPLIEAQVFIYTVTPLIEAWVFIYTVTPLIEATPLLETGLYLTPPTANVRDRPLTEYRTVFRYMIMTVGCTPGCPEALQQ